MVRMFLTVGAFLALISLLNATEIGRGKAIYLSNCISCHNRDPNQRGALGPELVGTPLEVMMLKVVTGDEYPAGYTPKRKTKLMKKFPQLRGLMCAPLQKFCAKREQCLEKY